MQSTKQPSCSRCALCDAPQAPLQPLQDNLESQTYETFEKDGTKYATYRAAVAAALRDRVPEAEAATRTTVLMVRSQRCGHVFDSASGLVPPSFHL